MSGVIQTGLMAFPELASELADACPVIEFEAQDFISRCIGLDETEREKLALRIARMVMGIHAGCHRLGIPLCETISDMLTLPTDTINQRLKELDNASVLQPISANYAKAD